MPKAKRVKRAYCIQSFVVFSLAACPWFASGVHAQESEPHQQTGLYFNGGFAPAYELHEPSAHFTEQLDFFSSGVQVGRVVGPQTRRGRGEFVVEIIPFWIAYYPTQTLKVESLSSIEYAHQQSFYTHGFSITPLLYRWNFGSEMKNRFIPFAQIGGGLLYTTKDFPQNSQSGHITSRFNFTPQFGFGEAISVHDRQSLDVSMRAVHISSAGLGEYNPGVNVTVQFTIGYSWWH